MSYELPGGSFLKFKRKPILFHSSTSSRNRDLSSLFKKYLQTHLKFRDKLIQTMAALVDICLRIVFVLVCLVSVFSSPSKNETIDNLPEYLIVGAGGGGIQLALFLEKFNLSYVILERKTVVGSFWTQFPRFEELISVNKWTRDESTFRRYDWHSMLEAPIRMYDTVQDFFPKGRDWQQYMDRVAKESGIMSNIEFNVEVEKIAEDARPCVFLVDGTERCAKRRVFIGTGLKEKEEPLLRAIGGIPYSRVTKDMAIGRRVCIAGNGNSGFEVAQNLFDVADRVNIHGKDPLRLSSVTKYTGDIRGKYLQVIENYHSKLLDTVLHINFPMQLEGLEDILEQSQIDTVKSVAMTVSWLEHFECDLFVITTGFQSNVPDGTTFGSRFPSSNDWYQSVDNPSVHYIGWLMHERDFRRGAGGFFSGFRYLIRNLAYHVRMEDEGISYPHETLTKEQAIQKVLERCQVADDLIILQDGVTVKDVIVPVVGTHDTYNYYEGITYQFHQDFVDRDDIISMYFSWGDGRSVNNVFDSNIRFNDTKNLINLFLHPVVQVGDVTRDIHEDPDQSWREQSYADAVEKTIRSALDGDLSLFQPKQVYRYERSVVNQSESYRQFEVADPDYSVNERILQALWKAVYTGKPRELNKLQSTAEQWLPKLYRPEQDNEDDEKFDPHVDKKEQRANRHDEDCPNEVEEEDNVMSSSEDETMISEDNSFSVKADTCIVDYLDPSIFEDPSFLEDVSTNLRNGKLVVIKNAFISEFAEHTWQLIDSHQDWEPFIEELDNGYGSFRHIPLNEDKRRFQKIVDVFNHPKTKTFINDLTGKDTSGMVVSYPTYYKSGDYSNPHNDHFGTRSVSMIWQLTKDWKPKWGGSFYWADANVQDAYHHPAFNTLVLFKVSAKSIHSVTPVSVNSKGKRHAFITWFHADVQKNLFSVANPIEELYATEDDRSNLTDLEERLILSLDVNSVEDMSRREKLQSLQEAILQQSRRGF